MAKLSILIFIFAIISSIYAIPVNVNRLNNRANDGSLTVTVESEEVFCSFLPRQQSEEIGASEDDAIPFCTSSTPNAPNQFPTGFIKTAHFKQDTNYVQVTGTIDNSLYVIPSDGGGQYDTKAPVGASCTGYKKFVNLVEPNNGRFCIRCCNDGATCDTGHSEAGCDVIIPGDYS
ncbi:14736_t:CDS:1 [Gigaspora margarita]|uniref:14736_t:CDS:1 n=1 Tax=Gigaspora margarita TaxID=4874 RepID=A0ABN7UGE5_GIGMA|nr:14736_t:CDS:1 [Gigaspora margarita]